MNEQAVKILANNLEELREQLNDLQQEEKKIKRNLIKIQSAKEYKFWQVINKYKKFILFFRKNKKIHPYYNIEVINKISNAKSKKKIAFFTERLHTGFGVDLVVDQQAKLLSKKYDVTVFAISIDSSFVKNKPYRVIKLPIPLSFNPIKQDLLSLKFFLKNKTVFNKFKTYCIHTPTFNTWLPFLKRNGKTIVFYYGNSPSNNYVGFKKYRKHIMDIMENSFYFKYADTIVSISKFLKESLKIKHRKKTHVIYLGSDHIKNDFKQMSISKRKQILKNFNIKNNDKLITYIGRLDYHNNPYKNTKLLFKLAKQLDDHKYKIITMGFPENNIQEEMYKAAIYSIANASNKELISILNKSTVHVSPSLWEGFNLPLIEAQALGVPVVAFNIGAHPEVVNNSRSGFLVKNEKEFFNKIKLLLSDAKLRKEFSEEAIKFSSKFTWKRNFNSIDKLI